jgi:hypothetical protein
MPASGPALAWTIITFLGDRTLLLTDAFGFLLSDTVGGTQTVTIPPNSDVAFGIGVQISFKQKNTAVLDFAAGAGVTIESRGALVAATGQFAVMSIVQDSPDVWSLFGDLA